MARAHWQHAEGHGCQHSKCENVAVYQWQREALPSEIAAETSLYGKYGAVVRAKAGPHNVGVFSCAEHALTPDALALRHQPECPAPDEGCHCE